MGDAQRPRVWSRRSVLRYGAGGLGALGGLVLAACGSPAGPAAPAGSKPAAPAEAGKPSGATAPAPTTAQAAKPATGASLTSDQVTLTFMHHLAGDKEQSAYDQIYEAWNKQYPNIKIESMVVPDQERLPKAQAMVAADQAPDMWRHSSAAIRLWAYQGQLLDLTDMLPANYGDNFLPALAAYCQYKGRYFGLPHTTDTSALFYREDAMKDIGITPPTELKDAWTFQQFGEINDKLLALKKQQYAFTHNQGYSSRWMPSFLYATGGKIVNDDFSKIGINTPEGISALRFIKEWTDKKWAPPAIWTTRVPNEEVDQFVRGTASMAILGQWNINYMDTNIKDSFKWGVTFIPKDKEQTTSLGGTPVVAWTKTKYPKEAAAFFEFFTSVDMLKLFDETANFMPVRKDMMSGQQMKFHVRDDLMQTFHKQIQTLPPAYAAYVARSYSAGVNPIVLEESSKMVLEGQSPEDTARRIEERGNKYIEENPDVEKR